ncbi:hypothetical protein [Snuella sedimenti]|uniref:Lipoprotein n=1 Tax=Snuella sedimenti TaxID=2798802 RepID=A0A8J7LS43_9FLAO|nr:hypothetical protein [Snuella sedimenti]MBJ6368010.1 hypothetical protein [Snuella sedimenti]
MMKTLRLLFVISGVFFLITACEENLEPIIEDSLTDLGLQAKTAKLVKKPLKAMLSTGQADDALTQLCSFTSETDFWGLEHQIGGGNSTLLGDFTTDITMCFHIVLNEQGPDLQNGFGEFNEVEGSMIAANGDKIYFVTPGSKLEFIQDDIYNFKFIDYCTIVGGAGRFENATGEFVSKGMVRIDGTGIDHHWEGTVILNK